MGLARWSRMFLKIRKAQIKREAEPARPISRDWDEYLVKLARNRSANDG